MAGNLLGEPLVDYVNDQVIARQKLHGASTRTTDELRYLNGRNAWIKLASGAELDKNRLNLLKNNPLINQNEEGDFLAKNNVLFGGLTDNNSTPREGITGPNRAYGVGGTEQFGYSPMPGITDMSFKCLNRGSIKKATLSIKAHNRNQFDVIDVLYMRLGYSVLLEWGFDKYLDNSGNVQNTQDTLIDNWFWSQKKSSYTKVHPKIEKYRKKYDGNYDAAFGIISNFSWNFAKDGTYNIKIEIISMGDIVESLKMNLPSLYSTQDKFKDVDGEAYAALLQENGVDDVPQSQFYDVLYPGLKSTLDDWWDRAIEGRSDAGGAPDLNVGISPTPPQGNSSRRLDNWTGRKFDESEPEKNQFPMFQSYGTKWTDTSNIKFYNAGSTTEYSNPTETIDKSFAFNEEKKQAVIEGINNLFSNGTLRSKTTPQEISSSPFADNFSKNVVEFARRYNVADSEGISSGTVTRYSSVVGNDSISVRINVPFGQSIIKSTVTIPIDDPFLADLDDINTTTGINVFTEDLSSDAEEARVEKLIKENVDEEYSLTNPKYSYIRDSWNTNYGNLKTSGEKWNAILNSTYGDKNFSDYIGISKKDLHTSVYEEFKRRKLADAYPKDDGQIEEDTTTSETEETPEPTEQEKREKYMLDQQMERLQKDFITKDRNRIYEFFYKKRSSLAEIKGNNINLYEGGGGMIGEVKDKSVIKLNIEPLDNQWYIRLGSFLNVLQSEIIPRISTDQNVDPPLIKIDTDTEKTICYTIDNVYSLNPKKLLVRNDFFINGLTPDQNPNTSPILKGTGVKEFVSKVEGNVYGKIMNIYFNFNRLEEIFDSTVANKTVSLFKAIKTICTDINESLGNINNIEPVIKENNTIIFIDQSTIPNLKAIAADLGIDSYLDNRPSKKATFEIYGLNYNKTPNESSFVRDVGLTTKIDKKYATMITIGATSQGSIPGVEATAFSRWNIGITDKFKNKITDPKDKGEIKSPLSSSAGKQLQSKYASLLANSSDPWQKFGLSDSGGDDGLKTVNDDNIKYSENIVSDFYALMQSENSFIKNQEDIASGKKNPTESSIGFLPFNLSLTMDGISGIKIYNKLEVQQNFLPSNYPETLEFIITQVNHSLKDNDWETQLETIATSKSVFNKK